MDVKIQKRLASKLLKIGKNKVVFDKEKLPEIKEAITKKDIRNLISKKIITAKKDVGISRYRARKTLIQKRKGRRSNYGSRKGKRGARLARKKQWMLAVRVQRDFIKNLRDKGVIKRSDYGDMYKKIKGGFFRSKRHIKLYIDEHKLVENVEKKITREN